MGHLKKINHRFFPLFNGNFHIYNIQKQANGQEFIFLFGDSIETEKGVIFFKTSIKNFSNGNNIKKFRD